MRVDGDMQRFRPLLDSLIAITGITPQNVRMRPMLYNDGQYDPRSQTITVRSHAPDPRFALTHEYGHMYHRANPSLFMEWFESVPNRRVSSDIREQFADAFAQAYLSISARRVPGDPGVRLLYDRLLSTRSAQ